MQVTKLTASDAETLAEFKRTKAPLGVIHPLPSKVVKDAEDDDFSDLVISAKPMKPSQRSNSKPDLPAHLVSPVMKPSKLKVQKPRPPWGRRNKSKDSGKARAKKLKSELKNVSQQILESIPEAVDTPKKHNQLSYMKGRELSTSSREIRAKGARSNEDNKERVKSAGYPKRSENSPEAINANGRSSKPSNLRDKTIVREGSLTPSPRSDTAKNMKLTTTTNKEPSRYLGRTQESEKYPENFRTIPPSKNPSITKNESSSSPYKQVPKKSKEQFQFDDEEDDMIRLLNDKYSRLRTSDEEYRKSLDKVDGLTKSKEKPPFKDMVKKPEDPKQAEEDLDINALKKLLSTRQLKHEHSVLANREPSRAESPDQDDVRLSRSDLLKSGAIKFSPYLDAEGRQFDPSDKFKHMPKPRAVENQVDPLYLYEMTQQKPERNEDWYIRPHHLQSVTRHPFSVNDDPMVVRSKNLPSTSRPLPTKETDSREQAVTHLEGVLDDLKCELEERRRALRTKVYTTEVDEIEPRYTGWVAKAAETFTYEARAPEKAKLVESTYDGILEELRRRERELLNKKRRTEYDTHRPPNDHWYELKTPEFASEMQRHLNSLKPTEKHRRLLNHLAVTELY